MDFWTLPTNAALEDVPLIPLDIDWNDTNACEIIEQCETPLQVVPMHEIFKVEDALLDFEFLPPQQKSNEENNKHVRRSRQKAKILKSKLSRQKHLFEKFLKRKSTTHTQKAFLNLCQDLADKKALLKKQKGTNVHEILANSPYPNGKQKC